MENPKRILTSTKYHQTETAESVPHSPVPEHEVQYFSGEEEGNNNNDIDDSEEERDVFSDTTEKPYSDITPASQQLITESQEDIREPHNDIYDDDDDDDIGSTIILQHQPP